VKKIDDEISDEYIVISQGESIDTA